MINRPIIISVIILMAAGTYRVLLMRSNSKTAHGAALLRVLVGGYMLAIIASIIDLVGGPATTVAGMLVALATTTALYIVLPDLFSRFAKKGA